MRDWLDAGFKFVETLAYVEEEIPNSEAKILKGKNICPKTASNS